MNILHRIEAHVSQPEDSETQRTQKTLAFILLLVSAIATYSNAFRYYSEGLQGVAFTYFIVASVSAAAFIAFLLVRPLRMYYMLIAFVVILSGMLGNTAAHLMSGGYTSGLLSIQWMTVSLVLAVLFLERRLVYVMIVSYLVLLLIAGYLETAVRDRVPDLDPSFIALDATISMALMGLLAVGACLYLFNQVERYRRRADDLLLNILPGSIATRLKESPETIADGYKKVTVLFADIVDFTSMSSGADPVAVVNKLNEIFSDFDRLAAKHGLEKIKTIGDAYMVAGGLPEPQEDHCQTVAAFAFDLLRVMERHQSWSGEPMFIRVGINSGPVVAGVIGEQKFIYDLWGDAVNVASRMESNGLASEIQVTQAVKDELGDHYRFEERGPITVKGKGEMVTYLLEELPVGSDQ